MSSKPPAQPSAPLDDAGEGPFPDQPGDKAGPRSWRAIVIAVVAVVAAAAVAGALLLNQTDEPPKEHATGPAHGLACPYLQQAADAHDSGDHAAYEAAIGQAEDVAEGALQTSGEAFGKPERIALELGLSSNKDPGHLTRMLELALQECGDVEAP